MCAIAMLGVDPAGVFGATLRYFQIEAVKSVGSYQIVVRTSPTEFGYTEDLRSAAGQAFGIGTQYSRTYGSFADVAANLFGEWTLTSKGASTEIYKFSIAPFAEADVTVAPIKIVSPLPQTKVTSTFVVAFSSPTSAGSVSAVGVQGMKGPPGRAVEGEYSFTGYSPNARIIIQVDTLEQSFTDRISPVDYTGVSMRYDLWMSVSYKYRDISIVTPVPEPTSIACAASGLASLGLHACRSRRTKRQAKRAAATPRREWRRLLHA